MGWPIMQDYGIYLEIFGFIMLLLTTGRNPHEDDLVNERFGKSSFDLFRAKIIPNRLVYFSLITGIGAIVLGLYFQLSIFNF